MSLRRRIALAAAVAVTAVAVAVAAIGYVSTRSHLLSENRSELRGLAHRYVQAPGQRGAPGPGQDEAEGQGQPDDDQPLRLLPQPLGAATGQVQVVNRNGTTHLLPGESTPLPVTTRVLDIARNGSGSVFYDAHVQRHHVEIYAVWDPGDRHVIQVALPLTEEDDVLNGLLLPYGLLIAGGILAALMLGLAISRSALRPIENFLAKTERVAHDLEHPERLEETGAIELRRLAASFNQALDALERSIEAQRHLVADASHELRTPIAALRSNIQIFLDSWRLPAPERVELQSSILAELDELTQVVADVVELARGSGPSTTSESIELDTVVREAVERTRRRAPDLSFKLKLEQTVIEGTPDRVGRAVANVIDNARKWSPPDGEIDVQLHHGTLTVRDHGPGFNERDLPHVFDRFYRAPGARRLPGSGLGLAIVKQAADAHGGWAEARNALGGGALVQVSFGVPEQDGSPAPAPVGGYR